MHAEDLLLDQCSNGETVKGVGESFPEPDVEPPFAFVVESIDSVDLGVLVVTSQQRDSVGIFNFVGEK